VLQYDGGTLLTAGSPTFRRNAAVYSSFATCKIKPVFDRQDLDGFMCFVYISRSKLLTVYLYLGQ